MSCVTLIGMPGSGKSTVGVLLAKALGYDFLDTDLLLQRREGMYLQDILERRGIEAFLDAEEAAVRSLTCQNTVIAPGGSVVCRRGAMEHLRALGPVLYLRVPLPELERRVNNITTRGIAMAPGQTLGDVYTLEYVRPAGPSVRAVRRSGGGGGAPRRSGKHCSGGVRPLE